MINLSRRMLPAREINFQVLHEYEKTTGEFRELLRQCIGGGLVNVTLTWKVSMQEGVLYLTPLGTISLDGEDLYTGNLCDCIGAVCYVVAKLLEEARHGDA